MMSYIFGFFIILSVFVGIVTGNISNVSTAALEQCSNAVGMCITLMGVMCLWSGLMRVAQNSGITDAVAKLLSPVIKFIFKGINPRGKAFSAISMNITANLLGLGNASTPLGIEAMSRLSEEENCGDTASNNMIMLVVLNTASLQLIPTTIAALRLKNGSESPFEIILPILFCAFCSAAVGIFLARILGKRRKKIK